jgi:hypothetical protein
MKIDKRRRTGSWLLIALFAFSPLCRAADVSANTVYDCAAQENRDKPTTVEILLAGKWKSKVEEVKRSFTTAGAPENPLKVRIKFFPFLDPPGNIGIGKCVTAESARLAIREAVKYNGSLDRLVMQDIMPHHWIKIGTTDTSELTWIPVDAEELARLTDPSLSTDQFQELYRRLARQKEKKRPFGMDSEKREETP